MKVKLPSTNPSLFLRMKAKALSISVWLFALLGAVLLWKTTGAPIGDYANYYYASRLLLEGQFDASVYEPHAFNQAVRARSGENHYVNYTPVPPFSALFYLPFAWIKDIRTSKLWFNILGFLAFLIAYYRLVNPRKISTSLWLLALPFLFVIPLLNNFYQGQSYAWLLAFLLEGFRQWERRHAVWAGVMWAFPIALKLFPAIMILLPLFRSGFKVLAMMLGVSLLLSLSPLFVSPGPVTIDYFTEIVPRLARGEITDPFTIFHQSDRAFFNKAFVSDAHLNPRPVAHYPALALALHAFFQLVILSALFLLLRTQKVTDFDRMAIILFSGTLLSGYGTSYGLLLLLPMAVAIPSAIPGRMSRPAAFLIIGFLCAVPIYQLQDWPLMLQFPRWYAMVGLFILIFLSIRPLLTMPRWAWAIIGLFLIIKGIQLAAPARDKNSYYLDDGRHGIIYDYRSKGRRLELYFFNEKGDQRIILPNNDRIWKDPLLTIRDDQIYLGDRQLTHTDSRKRKPRRLNDHHILYLSDEGRGPGFFTLRKLKIP